MKKIRISAVSYTNTKPFIYGLQHSDIINQIDLSLDTPSDCAQKLINNQVDIGLIPVAAVLNIPDWQIISDYCIGAIGAVNSVFIFSNCEIENIKQLQLDPQSRSSNNLAKVLMKNYWKLNPEFIINAVDYSECNNEFTAFVQIGDRTFGKKDNYKFTYDLADIWQKLTGLPFMFAAWIANKPVTDEFVTEFNKALKYGLDNRNHLFKDLPKHSHFDMEDYLMHKIDFNITDEKKKAMYLFLDYINQL